MSDTNDIHKMLEQIRRSGSFESANLSREIAINVQNFSGANISNAVVGSNMTNITNTIQKQAPGELKDLLVKLDEQVQALRKSLPADKRDEVDDNYGRFVKEATAEKPNRKWYSLSAEGLLEAATYVKDFTGNLSGTMGQLGKLFWPDFSLGDGH